MHKWVEDKRPQGEQLAASLKEFTTATDRFAKLQPAANLFIDINGEIVESSEATKTEIPPPLSNIENLLKRYHMEYYPDYKFTKLDEKGFQRAAEKLQILFKKYGLYFGRKFAPFAEKYVDFMYDRSRGWKTDPHGGNYSSDAVIQQFEETLK
jgi:hypothetical protein